MTRAAPQNVMRRAMNAHDTAPCPMRVHSVTFHSAMPRVLLEKLTPIL